MTDRLTDLSDRMRAFCEAREWEQFHAPKNLAMALAVEAAELMEPFQWLSESDSRALPEAAREAVALEVADVLLYLLRFCQQTGIDPVEAGLRKLAINESRYPVERSRGVSAKHDRLGP